MIDGVHVRRQLQRLGQNEYEGGLTYREQTVPGAQMFFVLRWDEWMVADFILYRDDGKVMLIDTGSAVEVV